MSIWQRAWSNPVFSNVSSISHYNFAYSASNTWYYLYQGEYLLSFSKLIIYLIARSTGPPGGTNIYWNS